MTMKCWNCGQELSDLPLGKISFREECPHCKAALHCCKNCIYYKIGKPNDCMVPGTDFVKDKQAPNLCEDFKLLGKELPKTGSVNDASKRLFGEDDSVEKKDFDSLFNP